VRRSAAAPTIIMRFYAGFALDPDSNNIEAVFMARLNGRQGR
jgi:hypothetical protein